MDGSRCSGYPERVSDQPSNAGSEGDALGDRALGSGARSPLRRVGALLALLVLLFGGGWASLTPAGEAYPFGDGDGTEEEKAAAVGFPDSHQILGMLALDRDIEDFREYADTGSAAGRYYQEEAVIALEMRPLRGRFEAVFTAAHADSSRAGAPPTDLFRAAKRRRPYIASPGEVWLPPQSDLPLSHPYALDVFFHRVDRSGEAEKGPLIRALHPGIVVAAASDWSGGQGAAQYRGGGLSPAAGNGLVVYDPASRLYCSYFHLSGVAQRPGAVVAAGDVVGRGGNSGMNARIKGHGEHVHLEIFDAGRDAPLSSWEILESLRK